MTPRRPDTAPIEAPDEPDAEAQRTARIAAQNDAFRRTLAPGAAPSGLAGRLVLIRAVLARGDGFAQAALRAVATDNVFTEANDPHGERDFGAMEAEGTAVWWKLDLLGCELRWASPRPDDPAATARVLTVLLPEDW